MWILIALSIYSVQFAGITAYTEIIPPTIVEAFYGDVVNFTCNTSLPEVFWMEDDQSFRGNITSIDGWTLSVHQVTVTKNATVNCFGKPAEDEFDTAQVILLEGPPTMVTTVATVTDDNAPLQVNLQSGLGSLQEGDSTNVSLTLTVTNISRSDNTRLSTHFQVNLQTSAGENATIFSRVYQPERLNTTMNITVFWTPDGDSVATCNNLYLTVTVSAVNSAGSSMPSNPVEISIAGCEATDTPPGSGCGAGCIAGIATVIILAVWWCFLTAGYGFLLCSQAHCVYDVVEPPKAPENNGMYEKNM